MSWQHLRTIETRDSTSFRPFDQHQCIFVHIPKAAGVSVCRALFGNLAGNHRSISNYQLIFSKKDFDRYFKFTFIRNPWDRVFSAYNFLKKGGMNKIDKRWAEANIALYENFDDFVSIGLQQPSIQKWRHFKPQSYFLLVPYNRRLQVDFLGFFENIKNDFEYVANKLKMGDNAVLRRDNVSYPGHNFNYKEFYTDKTRKIVSKVYARDIDIFGYNFDNSSLQSQLTSRLHKTVYHRH
jgi:hypothetical protein